MKQFVRIKKTIMEAEERFLPLPEDTKQTPVIMHVKGYFDGTATVGEVITITTTACGRQETGTLVEPEPSWNHNFGGYVNELVELGLIIESEKEALNE